MIPVTPPTNVPEKPVAPYVRQVGNFQDSQFFDTKEKAIAYAKLNGGLVQKSAIRGWSVMFSRRGK